MNNPSNIPPGFCQCGCGQRTNIVKQNDPKHGYKKGDYRCFVNYHNNYTNKTPRKPKTCVICGETFEPIKAKRQETQKNCSAKCRNAYISQKSAEKRANALRGRGEGKSYPKKNGRHEHRIVIEEILGRPLTSNEIVHHRDENILNSDPNNLKLVTRAEHAMIHLHPYACAGGERDDELLREPAAGY